MSRISLNGLLVRKDRHEGRVPRAATRRPAPRKAAAGSSKSEAVEALQAAAGNRAVDAMVRALDKDDEAEGDERATRPHRRLRESRGAGPGKGARSTATTKAAAGRHTSMPADVAEMQVYNYLLKRGEVGLQRPIANVAGVDAITARIVYDADERPTDAQIFLNEVITAAAPIQPPTTYVAWQREMDAALGKRLDLGDRDAEAVLRQAAVVGKVFLRVVRVGSSASGGFELRINTSETRRFGSSGAAPVFAHTVAAARDDEEEGQ